MGVCCWSSSWLCAVPAAMMEQHLSIAALIRVFSLNSLRLAVSKAFVNQLLKLYNMFYH